MIKIIKIKDLVKEEKKFPKIAVFSFLILLLCGVGLVLISLTGVLISPPSYIANTVFLTVLIVATTVGFIGITQLSYSIVIGKIKIFSIAFQVKTLKRVGILLLVVLLLVVLLLIYLSLLSEFIAILFFGTGLILSYTFGLVPFILIDEDYQSLDTIETLKKSYELMKKNKMKMLLLQLRYFLGWVVGYLVTTLAYDSRFFLLPPQLTIPFVILMVYIASKYQIAFAIFYKQIKEDRTSQPIEEV